MLFTFLRMKGNIGSFRTYLSTTELCLTLVKILSVGYNGSCKTAFHEINKERATLMSDPHSSPAGGGNELLFNIVCQSH